MKKLITALCALSLLSSCDDELKLVSRDFSVTLKSIDGNTAVVGKPESGSFAEYRFEMLFNSILRNNNHVGLGCVIYL